MYEFSYDYVEPKYRERAELVTGTQDLILKIVN